jgi:hypothetical protein
MALPEMFAERRNEVGNALLQSLIRGASFIGMLLDSVFQALVCGPGFFGEVPYAEAQFSDLALGVAPQSPGLFAVLAALLNDAGGDVFDAVEAFVAGHMCLSRAALSILAYPRIPPCGKLLDNVPRTY